ncbi:uncharacterized protein LOC115898730 [Rhinopithecus roxellana]|uniref:uncharacterized protein LOC115898730 n=1 Tax=Rhinopithecus roxellana TaxID=61622 RepID=UPI001237835C|nr:uncharacterized protein LOC115898730 [Rhinopithecus roxellana]
MSSGKGQRTWLGSLWGGVRVPVPQDLWGEGGGDQCWDQFLLSCSQAHKKAGRKGEVGGFGRAERVWKKYISPPRRLSGDPHTAPPAPPQYISFQGKAQGRGCREMAAAAGLGLQREAAEGKWPAWRMTESGEGEEEGSGVRGAPRGKTIALPNMAGHLERPGNLTRPPRPFRLFSVSLGGGGGRQKLALLAGSRTDSSPNMTAPYWNFKKF